ncbi:MULTISPECIES: IS110 family transposase [Paraburkholderia]|uniref:IS110 family transposase n=1 Tax=Paraburkholderia TaxID=1822464 RepID=UPI0015C53D3C|nr:MULTISPECIES: IS110 family transposase [Paraburkholderia]MCX4173812.1 IS110 family transposase [Paraburkholderia madseniana]MDQ6461816.1 IS110 family transposase [Paraburkholderia madseniana]NPT70916.1 IS110 family transposase [Paraburkholderia madseniana]
MTATKSRRAGSAAQITVVHPHAAAIDIGAQFHVVAVGPERDPQPVRSFRSFTKELHDLADWLEQVGITTIAMESTGVYWIPAFEILEAHGFEVVLVNARDAKNVPGRKTDVSDAQWLQKLHAYGLLRASFRPRHDVATLRSYLRQRERLLEYAAAHIQHMQKALMQMNLQLHHVVKDVTGATGMKIIRAIVAGERNAVELARHRDVRCKASVETIRDALIGNYKAEHVFELTQALSLYDYYQTQVAQCDERIELTLRQLQTGAEPPAAPLPAARYRTRQPNGFSFDVRAALYAMLGVDLTQLHGLGPYVALKLVAECGNDMSRWPTAKHFTSWLCLAPGNKISGGKILSSKTRRSSSKAAAALRLAAVAIGKTDTALGGFYRRLSARIGNAKAVTATARKIAVLFYNTLRYGMQYVDPGAAYYEERYRQRVLNNLTRRAESLGFVLQAKPT